LKPNNLSYSPLYENTLVRVISEFNSEMTPSGVIKALNKSLKRKVSTDAPGAYNINISRGDDGVYRIETAFMTYRDSRLTCLNLFSWIERNGLTEKNHNLYIDIKFLDTEAGPFKGTLFFRGISIQKIDKLKFILEFDEDKVYRNFPSRRYGFNTKSITKFSINQRFMPREDSVVDPKFYSVPDTKETGVNFERLSEGFLRMQYIGGKEYEKKPQETLDIITDFCLCAWEAASNPKFTKENILKFEKIVAKQNKIRESYLDYALFKKNFKDIRFTVDLVENPTTLDYYYSVIKDRIYDLLIDAKFSKNEFELNYDTNVSALQIREAKVNCQGTISNVEFVNSEIKFGNFKLCNFYDSTIEDARLIECNMFLDTVMNRCLLIDSFANRTTELINSDVEGVNSVVNTKMDGGIFRSGKIGVHAKISKDTIVIEYSALKPGYFVVGDKVIIPTKTYLKP
jgi:hypothetical protein